MTDSLTRMPLAAVLFDLDGLMIDSEPLSLEAWRQLLAAQGATFDETLLPDMIGRRVQEVAALVIRHHHLDVALDEFMQQREETLIAYARARVQPMPGLLLLLDWLDAADVARAVATSSNRRYAASMLHAIGVIDRVGPLVTGEDVTFGKPAPDIYLLAAAKLGVAAHACVVLEDSLPGVQAGRAAGMVTIAVPNDAVHRFAADCATATVPNLAAAQAWLVRHTQPITLEMSHG